MKNNNELSIKIYLKKVRKPLILIIEKKSYFDDLYNQLTSNKTLIKIGNFIFNASDFDYAILE